MPMSRSPSGGSFSRSPLPPSSVLHGLVDYVEPKIDTEMQDFRPPARSMLDEIQAVPGIGKPIEGVRSFKDELTGQTIFLPKNARQKPTPYVGSHLGRG